jgi:hypothetical protein
MSVIACSFLLCNATHPHSDTFLQTAFLASLTWLPTYLTSLLPGSSFHRQLCIHKLSFCTFCDSDSVVLFAASRFSASFLRSFTVLPRTTRMLSRLQDFAVHFRHVSSSVSAFTFVRFPLACPLRTVAKWNAFSCTHSLPLILFTTFLSLLTCCICLQTSLLRRVAKWNAFTSTHSLPLNIFTTFLYFLAFSISFQTSPI